MKKLFPLFVTSLALVFAACEKDPETEHQIGGNEYVLIKPDASFQFKATYSGMSPEEIVRDAFSLTWTTHWSDYQYFDTPGSMNRGFPDIYKDYENNILKFLSIDIIADNGDLMPTFITGWDFFILNEENDTIAYIPNDVIRAAEIEINEAYESEDYTEVYRLFDEAYTYKAIE